MRYKDKYNIKHNEIKDWTLTEEVEVKSIPPFIRRMTMFGMPGRSPRLETNCPVLVARSAAVISSTLACLYSKPN